MSNATSLFNNAELALAAYAALQNGTTADQDQIRALAQVSGAPMSLTEAVEFARRYPTVVTSFDDSSTGLQVTVFKDTLGDLPGNLSLALRGSTFPEDFATGVDIVGAGAGYNQIVALANWWRRISTAPGQMVSQFSLVELSQQSIPESAVVLRPGTTEGTSYVLVVTPQVLAFTEEQGNISAKLAADPDQRVEVTGHSLGGHLALAFSSLFDSRTGQVTVFNAPGFASSTVNQNFFDKLGGSIPTGSTSAGLINNVVSDEALVGDPPFNFVAGMHSRPGKEINISIEKQTNSDEPNPFLPALNHSIVTLTDSLAVYKLLADLVPVSSSGESVFTTADYKLVLNQAVQGTAAGYERIVDALNKLFRPADAVPALPAGNTQRDELYKSIQALTAVDSAYTAKKGQLAIEAVTGFAGALVTNAQTNDPRGLAWRYALKELDPFVVVDASNTIYARFQPGGANAGELDIYDPAARTGTLTTQWLQDRAALLQRRLDIAARDENNDSSKPPVLSNPDKTWAADNFYFEDRATGYVINQGANGGQREHDPYIIFGSDRVDAISGSSRDDRLYAGGSTDYLIGKGGDDYLDGGTGLDIYEYSAVRATGLFTTGPDGHDSILDVDGKGILRFEYKDAEGRLQTTVLAGVAIKETDGKWKTPDGRFLLEQAGADLKVTFGAGVDGSVTIRAFDFTKAAGGGHFGIRLSEALMEAEPAGDIFGDRQYQAFTGQLPQLKGPNGEPLYFGEPNFIGPNRFRVDELPAIDGNYPEDWRNPQLASAYTLHHSETIGSVTTDYYALPATLDFTYNQVDELGNLRVTDAINPNHEDLLFDGEGNERIVAGGGNDAIAAYRGGDDVIQAGAGRDVVLAGDGNDIVEGAADGTALLGAAGLVAGGDMIAGEAGDDELYGNTKVALSEAIRNGETDSATGVIGDFLSGGAGSDWAVGDRGNDVLLGGDGADILIGGAGDDSLRGDDNRYTVSPGWSVTRQVGGSEVSGLSYRLLFTGTITVADGPGGNDVLYGGSGNDWAFGGRGDDFIDGGSGNDVLFGDEGADVVIGGTGNDVLVGDGQQVALQDQGGDFLDGGDGEDTLEGNGGDDVLIGGIGNDILRGGEGNDILIGGPGQDVIIGGAGRDTYVYNRGDGTDIIIDSVAGGNDPEASILVLGEGIRPDDLKFRFGSLLIDLGPSDPGDPFAGNDEIHFQGFNKDYPDLTATVGEIRFADGTVLNYADILARGFDVDGTALDDAGSGALIGSSVADRIRGFAGSDELEGRDGDDVLIGDGGEDRLDGGNGNDRLDGGGSNDILAGGMGSDDYLFIRGDGIDTLIEGSLVVPGLSDPDSTDRIVFGAGITRDDVSLLRTGAGDLIVRYGDGDEILVEGQYRLAGAEIERIVFTDGATIEKSELDALEIGVLEGTADADELYGSGGNDTLRGHEGDDVLDGGPIPERRVAGARLITGDDVLEGGTGSDRYVLYWGMGSDRIIDAPDGQINTLELRGGATLESVKTVRDGEDLLVRFRGSNDSARVEGFFSAGAAGAWRIASAEDGSLSLLDVYDGQSAAASAHVLEAMADYKQQLLGEWRARGQSDFDLPTHVYVRATWSQTVSEWTQAIAGPQGPVITQQTFVNDPVIYNAISGYGVRQGGRILPLLLQGNVVEQIRVSPLVESSESDAPLITAQAVAGGEVNVTSYSFYAGFSGPFDNSRTYSNSRGFLVNTITESSYEGWVLLNLRLDDQGTFRFNLLQVTEQPVIEEITAGDSDNTIVGMLDSSGDRLALINAGAGEDHITAGAHDFAFGGEGDDNITGGAYAYGGDGDDRLVDGRFLAGGAGDDFLGGGEGETTFHFRIEEAGQDRVQDRNGISLQEFLLRAGFSDSLSNLAYGGKYRLGGDSSFQFQGTLEQRFGGRDSDAYQGLFSGLTYAELDLGNGETRRYAALPAAPGFPRGVADGFFRGPYRSDGYFTWVYNSVEDIMRDFAALGLQFNPADVSLIPIADDFSGFTADNYRALEPFFANGILEKDVVELSGFRDGVDEWTVGFVTPDEYGEQNRVLRLVWGEDKVIDVELPSATDLIGHGVEEIRFGNNGVYVGDLIELAQETGFVGTPFDDYLRGTDGDDRILGLAGWDFIEGGTGNDVLGGGAGIDEFLFDLGAGSDTILDPDADDLILFGNMIEPDQIRLGLGSLRLAYGTAGDKIHFEGFDPDNVYGATLFAALQFWGIGPGEELSDGSFETVWTLRDELTFADVLSRGFDVTGSAGNDMLRGTNIHDRFYGDAGNDMLTGGAGGDTYFFNAGDGVDTVIDATEAGAINRVVLRDYLAADITGFRDGQHVVLQAGGSGDAVRILWNDATGAGVDVVEFADGATWDRAFLDQLGGAGNSAPVVAAPIGGITADEDSALNFVIPVNTFQDADAGDVLSYAATLANGAALPGWLTFDAETRTFSGLPANGDVGTIQIKVTATDGSDASVSDTFNLAVLNVNDAPLLAAALADQNAVEDQAFSFAVPAGTFADEDAGDLLTYSATLSNGTALPEWLSFDAATNIFSGVPANADVGMLTIRLTATDSDGASVSDTFTVSVGNVNDAPVLGNPLMDQAVTAGMPFSYIVPVNTFTDEDMGDSVTLSARLAGGAALPDWLAFDAATGTFSGTFSGTPSASSVGVLDVEVVATDAAGASAGDQFVLTVNPAAGLVLTGTAGADTLIGGYGNDLIDGLAGADQLYGGDGDDSYIVDHVNDLVFENPDEGHDTVFSSVNHTLSAHVEDLILTGAANRNATGNALANTLIGNSGANRLDGGAGADVLAGGLGNDTYIVDDVLDQVFEAPSAGTDTVQSSVSYALGANVEHLTLTGEAAINGTGNELANTLTGNAAANTLTGGAGNDRLIGGGGGDTLIGGAGNDTYVIDLIDDLLIEAAGEGTDAVESHLDFTLAEHFENLVLTGNAISGTGNAAANRLTGNALANVLMGLDGNDVLDGKGGADTLIGGAGNDIYVVDDSADVTVELPGEGTDTVQSSVSYTIGTEIERLVLTGAAAIDGAGNALDNRLTGNAAANVLSGLDGDDILDGKGGADTLIGGAGNDSYIVDDSYDAVIELAGEGVDSVTTGVSYALSANVENLTLSGINAIDGTGTDRDNRLTGNAAANVLTGLAGNDVLDGKGGADTLIGGAGDDTYIVDSIDDVIVEVFDEGMDAVQTALTWTLGAHLENLTLTGAAAVNATGNTLDNVLIGNNASNVLTGFDGNDTLDGRGGADVMLGGAGDDHYFVDRATDVVVEYAGEGNDTVHSRVTYTLGDHVENLALTGTANIAGSGNTLDNVITGNAGNNLLDGGIGADVLAGGLGNDSYIVDDAGDVVIEAAGGGADLVKAGIAYTLTANVENLTLTGTAAVAGTGNALDNILTGNNAANLLTGLEGNDTLDGKAGADTLIGGAGDDVYIVDSAGDLVLELSGEGVDTVRSSLNYVLGDHLENLVLTGAANRSGTGNSLDNMLVGNKGANAINGLGGNDVLVGGLGNDIYRFDPHFGHDVIIEDDATPGNLDRIVFGAGVAASDISLGRLNDDLVLHTADRQHSIQVLNWFAADASKVERIEFANGTSWDLAAIESTALQVVDMPGLLRGNDQISVLLGQVGNTVLEGADGDDVLIDTDGNNLFIGGEGNDAIIGGAGNDLFIGGAGNDVLTTGAGNNLIAYNAGGGIDTIYADAGAENTLSLGGGLQYSDLSLSRNDNDLVLNAGTDDKIVFKDWYYGHGNLLNLQLILDATEAFDQSSTDPLLNQRVQNFNFLGLVGAFDAAQSANPGLSSWALSDALMQFHLSGSDAAAVGGDLAYWYARNDGLNGVSLAAAQGVMGGAGFGADAQSLHPFSGLQEGLVRLS